MMRFRLLQARLPDDPVREEERVAFAERLAVPLDQVLTFDLLAHEPNPERVIEGVDAVLVGGSGAFSIYGSEPWLAPFIDTLGQLAEQDFPTFASCFGFQALVLALGGQAAKCPQGGEVGSFDLELTDAGETDPLFGSLPRRFVAQEGHKDIATRLPAGLTNLAASERCPYQAFRLGRHVVATQFHPELTAETNRKRFERYLDMYAEAFGASQAEQMRTDAFRDSTPCNGLLARFAEQVGKDLAPVQP